MYKNNATKTLHSLNYKKNLGKDGMLTVNMKVDHIEGNTSPYFSITGDISKGSRMEVCGCIHDEILKHFPKLKPIVAIHLSDIDGKPMHWAENGWYYICGYYGGMGEQYVMGTSPGQYNGEYRLPTQEECLQVFADHVRLPIEEARIIAERCRVDMNCTKSRKEWVADCKAAIIAEMEKMIPRWKEEALAAIRFMDTDKGSAV